MTRNLTRALSLLELQIVDKNTRKALDEVSTYLQKSRTKVENVRKYLDEGTDYSTVGIDDSELISLSKEYAHLLQKSVISAEIEQAVDDLRKVARSNLA